MNTTIENLKQQAINELNSEQQTEQTQQVEPNKPQITEIIAEVISLETLQNKLSENNKATNQTKLAELFGKLKTTDNIEEQLKIHAEISQAMQQTTKQVLLDMANLPRYIYYTDNTGSYLIEAKSLPKQSTEKREPKEQTKFVSGDLIYLLGKDMAGNEVKSQVYKVTLVGLVGMDDHEPVKASIAVLKFEQQCGNKRAIEAGDKAIFAGLTYHKWHKVQK